MINEAKRGYFITFEGIDGCGKTTLIKNVERELTEKGIRVMKVSMLPHGLLRTVFKEGKFVSKAQELLLARAMHEEAYSQIREIMDEGFIVLCDRGPDSYYAYQGAGNEQLDLVKDLEKLIGTEITPDLTFYIDIDLQTSQERISSRGQDKDVFEKRGEDYHKRVKDYFDQIARKDSEDVENDVKRWLRIHVLDGKLSPGLIAMEASLRIEELFMREE